MGASTLRPQFVNAVKTAVGVDVVRVFRVLEVFDTALFQVREPMGTDLKRLRERSVFQGADKGEPSDVLIIKICQLTALHHLSPGVDGDFVEVKGHAHPDRVRGADICGYANGDAGDLREGGTGQKQFIPLLWVQDVLIILRMRTRQDCRQDESLRSLFTAQKGDIEELLEVGCADGRDDPEGDLGPPAMRKRLYEFFIGTFLTDMIVLTGIAAFEAEGDIRHVPAIGFEGIQIFGKERAVRDDRKGVMVGADVFQQFGQVRI